MNHLRQTRAAELGDLSANSQVPSNYTWKRNESSEKNMQCKK